MTGKQKVANLIFDQEFRTYLIIAVDRGERGYIALLGNNGKCEKAQEWLL